MRQNIIIGLITYKRPKMLKAALMSLINITNIEGVSVEIVIVDNDNMATAKDVVNACRELFSCNIHYLVEENRGIPFARNKVIEKAIELEASELAFFDDDEVVQSDWLDKLYSAYKHFGCDVVTGPVVSTYPENAPTWALTGKFYEGKRFETGSDRPCAATGNILFSMKCFIETFLRFDEELALTGGSDTCLTKEIVKGGGCIKWVDDAIVFERIPESRLNLKWIMQRNYRVNLYGIKYSLENKGLLYTYFFSILSFVKYFMFGLLCFFSLPVKRHFIIRSMICFTKCYAIVIALFFESTYEEYKTIHGE